MKELKDKGYFIMDDGVKSNTVEVKTKKRRSGAKSQGKADVKKKSGVGIKSGPAKTGKKDEKAGKKTV